MKVPKLEIKRLQLIEINERHINNLFTIYKDEEIMRYCDCCVHKSIAETEDLLALFERRIKEGTGISWGISLKDNPQNIIGTISYNNYIKDFTANIGYMLSKEFWHQGIMMEALNIFIKY
jgi:ribosomal-protein-alanine N-acetyltransferase